MATAAKNDLISEVASHYAVSRLLVLFAQDRIIPRAKSDEELPLVRDRLQAIKNHAHSIGGLLYIIGGMDLLRRAFNDAMAAQDSDNYGTFYSWLDSAFSGVGDWIS